MAELRIVQYTSALLDKWDEFVINSVNGTLMHRQKFLSYHPADRFEDHSLLVYDGDYIAAVFPAAIVEKEGKKILKSHPGSSYGFFVFNQPPSIRKCFELFELFHNYCKEQGFERIEFRMAPKIFNSRLMEQLEFSLLHHGYYRESEELSTYYDLEDFPYEEAYTDFVQNIPQKERYYIRKGERAGYEVKITKDKKDAAEFHKLLANNLESKYGRTPTHTLEELYLLMDLLPDEIRLAATYDGDLMTSGCLMFTVNARAIHIFYTATHPDYIKQGVLRMSLGAVLHYAKLAKLKFVNYGISTEDGGKQINWPLFAYKEKIGGTGVLRTYWMKDLT